MIVSQLGGKIDVSSRVNIGSLFFFSIPIEVPQDYLIENIEESEEEHKVEVPEPEIQSEANYFSIRDQDESNNMDLML